MKPNESIPDYRVSPVLATADAIQFAEYFKDVKNARSKAIEFILVKGLLSAFINFYRKQNEPSKNTGSTKQSLPTRLAIAESEASHWCDEYLKLQDGYNKLFDRYCSRFESNYTSTRIASSGDTSTLSLRKRLNNLRAVSRRNQVFNLSALRHE